MPTLIKNPAPKQVQQDMEKFHCWAATLESWFATRKPPIVLAPSTQKELLAAFSHLESAEGGLMIGKAMVDIMLLFQMRVDIYRPKKSGPIPGQAIYQRLKDKSYLWAFYLGGPDLGEFLGHAVVIYGVMENQTLRVMDPMGGVLTYLPISELNKTDTVFVCWHEAGPGWSDYMFNIAKPIKEATR